MSVHLSRVIEIAAVEYGKKAEDLTGATKLSEIGDSLDAVEFAMALEEAFSIEIDDEEIGYGTGKDSTVTLEDAAKLVGSKVAAKEAPVG